MRRSPGFTLPELIAVIVIVGVLAAIAVPKFNQGAIDTTWFTEQLKAALRFAQRQAVAQRRLVYVRVDSAPAQLRLCYDAACTQPLADFASGANYALSVPAGVSLTASVSPFSFDGLGQPSSAVTLSVNGRPITVTVGTGYVQ